MGETSDMLRETATRLFGEHCEARHLRDAEQGNFQSAAWAAVEDAGLHRALVPEDFGGYGVDIADALSLLRVAGEFALPLPLAETMLASWLLAGARIDIPDGPLTIAPVVKNERLALTRTAAGWHVSGTATRIPWARDAAGIAVLAEHGGQTYVALLAGGSWTSTQAQNTAREPRDTIAVDAAPLAVAPAAAGIGFDQLRAIGAAMRALQIAGALTKVVAMTCQYAQDRVQFGRPIGKFQAVQQNLAIMAGQTAAAVAASDLGAEAVANGVRLLPIAAAKARCGEAASLSAGIAHQSHGAIGFTYEHSLHFFTKRLWSWRDEFGNESEWNQLVGRHMLAAGADRLWTEITAA
jgi:alkylation response protein AidB-like acyl-CoA dehydrogenase